MRYYQHKTTGELLGSLHNLREHIQDGKRMAPLTEIVRPNKHLGTGIISELMTFIEINRDYKRISKKKALHICPDFGQMRHVDTEKNFSIFRMVDDITELLPIRGTGRGIAFTAKGKAKLNKYFEQN